jgi:hypothetical protein
MDEIMQEILSKLNLVKVHPYDSGLFRYPSQALGEINFYATDGSLGRNGQLIEYFFAELDRLHVDYQITSEQLYWHITVYLDPDKEVIASGKTLLESLGQALLNIQEKKYYVY